MHQAGYPGLFPHEDAHPGVVDRTRFRVHPVRGAEVTTAVSSPARIWAGSHRLLLSVIVAIVLAVAATVAVILLTSSTPSPSTSSDEPVVEEELTPTQEACLNARVMGC